MGRRPIEQRQAPIGPENSMDKKAKKKIDQLRQQIQRKRQQLAGAKQQDDEPGEVERLEREIAEAQAQIEKLQGG